MNKLVFLSELASKLTTLPRSEINKSLEFYGEMIDDRMEDGMNEEEAVRGLGDIEEVAQAVMLDAIPLTEMLIPRGPRSKGDTLLLILCSPLIIALFALIFAFYATVWLAIISLFLLELSFVLAGIAGVIASVVNFSDNILISILMFFGGLISIGIGIVTYRPLKMVSKKLMGLTTWFLRTIKSKFIKKGV